MSRATLRILGVSALSVLPFSQVANAEVIYGMTAASSLSNAPGVNLVRFDSATPGTITNIGAFTGVVAGHALRSIDFRPATGELFAISTSTAVPFGAQLYTVNLNTAALTTVGTGFALGTSTSNIVDMDFNPTVDRIRITTAAAASNNNFRANPNDGTLVATDTNLAYAAGDPNFGQSPVIVGTAYSNNVAGALQTTLYGWDYADDSFVTIGGPNGVPSPNGGQMSTIFAPPGFLTFNAGLDMDISGITGTLYATHDDPATGTTMGLFTLNPATGAQTFVGNYPAGTFIPSISVVIPEPASLSFLGLCAVAASLRIRRK
jgi:hypothetical protein